MSRGGALRPWSNFATAPLMAGLGGELAFHEVVEDACPPVLDRGLPGFTQVHADGVALPHEPFHALVVDRLG